MFDYYIRKHITLKKKNPFDAVINFFILLLAVPVIAISVLSLLFYFLFMWILTSFTKNKNTEKTDEPYLYTIGLLANDNVQIILEEKESDTELSLLNDLWMENVYNKETCLYRAHTTPFIKELSGKILCFYLKEKAGGAILQVITGAGPGKNPLDTRLVFLDYHSLKVTVIDETGDYYLHNDEKNADLILGFNKKQRIRMEIIHS